ncbi:restriction endonuclease subunit S [Ligilactobacillus salivarius]
MAKSFFYDIWERKKLGNVAENLSYGLNLPSTNYDGNNIYLRITDIDDESHTLNRDNLTSPNLRKFDKNILDYKLTENDVVFARTGASVGKTYVYTPTDGNIYFAGFLVRAKFKSSILANFVFYTTLTSKYLNYVKVTSQRSGQPGVNAREYGNFAISITDSTEQFRIISLLKKLDSTINLHERKCEELALIKKALLQKLFPKKDKFKPEVRYKNFSDAWEQRKLGEVSTRVRGNDGRMDLPTLTISAANGWLDQKERFSENIAGKEQKNYTLLSEGELSYNHGNSKLAKYGTVFVLRNYKEALVPRVYHSFKTDSQTSADFIEYIFSTKRTDRELSKLITSGARMDGLLNINFDNFMSIKINLPLYDEQLKIVKFLREFDTLITLHQRKLEKLKQLKKFLLQNMFI